MTEQKQIEEMAKVLLKLTYDLRTNMTSITRYVRHERAKHPNLTEGQFIDRHLKYRELANTAVDNILKCINDNEELRQIENICSEMCYRKQIVGENISQMHPSDEFICEKCGLIIRDCCRYEIDPDDGDEICYEFPYQFCPRCGMRVKGDEGK